MQKKKKRGDKKTWGGLGTEGGRARGPWVTKTDEHEFEPESRETRRTKLRPEGLFEASLCFAS